MSQLGLGLGLTKGGVVPFNPLSLNPYLLFDTRSSMIGTFENPTLDLDPSKPDTLNVITATRAGVATYTDAAGVIQSADPDTVRVDHVQGEELTPTKFQRVGYTDFSSGVTLDGVTKTNQSTPYGDGILLTQDTSSGEHNIVVSVTNTGQHTFSLKVKPDGVTKFSLSLEYSTSNSEVVYDTVAETSTIQGSNVSDASLEDLGSGWFLVKLTNDSTVSIARIRLRTDSGLVSYVGDGVSGLFLANPQVEEGTTASDFVANTTGSPKFITGATYGPRVPMILVEPSATNLTPSTDFISQGTASIVSGIDAPDGSNNAWRVSDIQLTTGDRAASQTASISPFTEYTGSLYVRGTAGETISFYSKRVGGTQVNSPFVQVLLTGEWQRVKDLTFTTLAENTGMRVHVSNTGASDTADVIDVWGAQVEAGSVATSYIPTSGSTVTRAADDLVISGSAFSSFFNASEGTVYVESVPQDGINEFPYYFEFSNGTTANRYYSYRSNTFNYYGLYISGTSIFNTGIGSVTLNSLNRISYSYKSNDYLGSANGATPVPETGAVPTGISQLLIGNGTAPTPRLMTGRIKRLIYWPYHSDSL